MTYILELIALGAFFAGLHYFTELTKSQKLSIICILLVVVVGATMYNSYTSKQQEKLLNVVLKFKQNKTIKCGDIEVNSSNYTLSIGTYTFIGKKGTPYYDEMVNASSCK